MNDQLPMMSQSHILQNHENYVVWQPYPPENLAVFARLPAFNAPPLPPPVNQPGRVNWKGNKPVKRKNFRRSNSIGLGPGNVYVNDMQRSMANHSGCKGRRFHHPRRKFSGGDGGTLVTPFAPRNTTSFIIRAKKSGGIASLVSPCPVTPTILPTPMLSPSREVMVEMAKEEWGVNGYGSMKGLIRLRSEKENFYEDEEHWEEDGTGASKHMEVEKRLDHNLSRFEMIYPITGDDQPLKNRVDQQNTQIAHLEEENLTLRERIFLMERELDELRRRVVCLETGNITGDACSEKSVGNDGHDGNCEDSNGDCV